MSIPVWEPQSTTSQTAPKQGFALQNGVFNVQTPFAVKLPKQEISLYIISGDKGLTLKRNKAGKTVVLVEGSGYLSHKDMKK